LKNVILRGENIVKTIAEINEKIAKKEVVDTPKRDKHD